MATTSFYPADPDDILSWTKNDKGCLQSQLFNKYGVLYEFEVRIVTLTSHPNRLILLLDEDQSERWARNDVV